MHEDYVYTEDALKMLKISSRSTLQTYVEDGLLQKYKIGKKPAYSINEINELMRPRTAESNGE